MVSSSNPQDPTYWARDTAMYETVYGTPEENKQEAINKQLRKQSSVTKSAEFVSPPTRNNTALQSNSFAANNAYSIYPDDTAESFSLGKFADLLKKLNSYKR